jgi:poly-gamma-glutamate capsule biosynthesis protein CapA/YwtB (metallophosphatase superfamily)
VLIAGDWAPIRAFDSLVVENPLSPYGDLLPVIQAASLRIVNCECALSADGRPVWKSGSVFRARPAHVRGLAEVPFDAACLANNHVLDYGLDALVETVEALRAGGVRVLGAGLGEEEAWTPLSFELENMRLSLVNFSEGEDLTAARGGPGVAGWEIPRVCESVRQLKQRGDCVLVVAHAGLEYVPFPPPYLQRAFRSIIEAGADCVVAHHAHVPQGIELHRGRPIVYSLGNFLFYQPTDLYWRKIGFLLELRIGGRGLEGFEVHPYRITDGGLRALAGGEEAEFRRMLQTISRPLAGAGGCERAWEAYLEYYGAEGLQKELTGIVEALQTEPPKGAAMLRNRLTTPQHAELWRDLLNRIIAGGPAPPRDLAALVREWFERKTPPGVLAADAQREAAPRSDRP